MRVVLRENVDGLGRRGDVVDVARGHARNLLIPRGLAIVATDGIQAQADGMRRARMLRDAKDREAAEEVAKRLVTATVNLSARAGEGGRLFGSITADDVARAIHEQTGIEIDRKKLVLDDHIKEVGSYQVPVRLHAEVEFPVSVEVTRG